jgi:enoyl-CoA hydratase/carnithine racemase
MVKIQAAPEHGLTVARDEAGVVTVAIDRPARKNALTFAMWRALGSLVREIGEDPATRCIVLRGAGADFCAGADIGEFETVRRDAETARAYEASNSAAFDAIRHSPAPTIAAISGICFGGGFGVAAACDLRIATEDARFSVPAARLGLAYPQDAMVDIVSAAGPQMARYLAFSAAAISAAEAKSAGFLLETVADRDALDRRILEIAGAIANNAPLSIRASKAAIHAVATGDPADAARAQALGDATFDSGDYAEGRAAFLARKPPRFTGK